MYVYLNALKNLLRNRGRNSLIGIILLIVITATTVSLAINAASETIIDKYKKGFGVETTIITDWEYAKDHAKVVETTNPDGSISTTSSYSGEEISLEKHMEFADSNYVKDTLFSAFAEYASDELHTTSGNENTERTLEGLMNTWGVNSRQELIDIFETEEELEKYLDAKTNTIGSIFGYSNSSLMIDFKKGEKKLTDGKLFKKSGDCLISTELAKENNLKVGDSISVSGSSKTYDKNTIPLKIVGIFEDFKRKLNAAEFDINAGIHDIIVGYDTLYDSGFHYITPSTITYFLVNAEAPAAFLKELRGKGLDKCFTLDYDIASYNKIVEPVKKMSSIATTFGIIILITGAVILVFLSILTIRERKYEVGVLRAIGMKKHQLARGMIYESLSLVIIFTLVGLPLGTLLAKPIAGILLDTTENINITVSSNPVIFLLVLLTAAMLGMLSSLIAILYIARYEPMKILSEQK